MMESSLFSYVAKTCMLHLSEEQNPQWWTENSISRCVLQLFKLLKESLDKKHLAHYFIDSLNLFNNTPSATLHQSLILASDIVNDPGKFISFHDDGTPLAYLNSITEEVSKLHQISPAFSQSNMDIFLGNTELYKEHLRLCIENSQMWFVL